MPHISRRGFARLLGTAAVASSLPAVSQAQAQPKIAPAIPKYIRLSSNENPYGPSPAALKAIADSFPIACRYPDDSAEALQAELAKLHGVSTGNVIMGAGSGGFAIDEFNADNFDHADLDFFGGGVINSVNTGARPIEMR